MTTSSFSETQIEAILVCRMFDLNLLAKDAHTSIITAALIIAIEEMHPEGGGIKRVAPRGGWDDQ